MINFLDIINSWIDSYNPTPEQRNLANERKEICNLCENLLYLNNFELHICKLCNCPIKKKIFTSKPCEKWQK